MSVIFVALCRNKIEVDKYLAWKFPHSHFKITFCVVVETMFQSLFVSKAFDMFYGKKKLLLYLTQVDICQWHLSVGVIVNKLNV